MNALALLGLIASLYEQLVGAKDRIEELERQLREREEGNQ